MSPLVRALLAATAIASVAGCANTATPSNAISDIAQVVSPGTCTGQVDITSDAQAIATRIQTAGEAIKQRVIADVSTDTGDAARLFDAVLTLLQSAADPSGTPSQNSAAGNLSVGNIQAFVARLHQAELAIPKSAAAPTPAEQQLALDVKQFNEILVTYVEAYIQGNYVDRLGNKLPAPTFSSTVGDTEIAGILSVLMDAVGDFFLRTPIWVDNAAQPKYYYPPYPTADAPASGAAQTPPTAYSIMDLSTPGKRLFTPLPLVNQPQGYGAACGIDAVKARAIAYLSETAALKANTAGGLLAAQVGGTGISFVMFQKISIGDSQTIRVMVETLLSKLAGRIAMEAAYHSLVNLDDAQYGRLADLLLYMAAHPQPATAAKPAGTSS